MGTSKYNMNDKVPDDDHCYLSKHQRNLFQRISLRLYTTEWSENLRKIS